MASTSTTLEQALAAGQLRDDGMSFAFPQIDGKNAHGKTTHYQVVVYLCETDAPENPVEIKPEFFDNKPLEQVAYIRIRSSIEGGVVRAVKPTVVTTGKNLKRANATNALTQAIRDGFSKHNKHKQSSQPLSVSGVIMFPPMLAQVLAPDQEVREGSFIQRKFNGVRAVATINDGGEVVVYSRSRHMYGGTAFDHIRDELEAPLAEFKAANRTVYLDGEFYCHGVDLQVISGIARRSKNAIAGDKPEVLLNFNVYDMFEPAAPAMIYSERKAILDSMFNAGDFKHVCPVETFAVANRAVADAKYQQFLSEGYEGAIVRLDEPYRYSNNAHHSKQLLKMKPVFDREDKVVDFTAGTKGKGAGSLLLVLQTETPAGLKCFTITVNKTEAERKALYRQLSEVDGTGRTMFEREYKDKKITYQYEELSTGGIPLRARVQSLIVRDYE